MTCCAEKVDIPDRQLIDPRPDSPRSENGPQTGGGERSRRASAGWAPIGRNAVPVFDRELMVDRHEQSGLQCPIITVRNGDGMRCEPRPHFAAGSAERCAG